MRRPHKYGATAVSVNGISFPSKKEAARWCELVLLQKAGEITDLERQVRFPLHGRDNWLKSDSGRTLVYVADFVYFDKRENMTVIEDSKGAKTPEYKLKKAILAAQGLHIKET